MDDAMDDAMNDAMSMAPMTQCNHWMLIGSLNYKRLASVVVAVVVADSQQREQVLIELASCEFVQ